ncbi:hypothetical protein DY000_02060307 [Brassica cretica]|uniref:Uncharacterized protein n=1 Tax=Brassica cretica TaxID=69181 RepID=A0ABQ7AW64_BRACR|nr:hypothetical protein DY000_02060307 [Brassica cretica]
MAPSFFCPLPTTTAKWLEELYTVHGVDRVTVVDLASTTESPEAVPDGFGGAYLTFFETCGLFYPIPEPTLSVLARLGRNIIHGIPYSDQNWREEFFVFKIDEVLGSKSVTTESMSESP